MANELTKVCIKCGEEKPLSEFNKGKYRKDGHQCWCKICKHNHYINTKEHLINRHIERDNNRIREAINVFGDIEKIQKVCGKCGISKPLSEYCKNKGSMYGVDSICKICKNKRAKDRRLETKKSIPKKIAIPLFDDDGCIIKICRKCNTRKSLDKFNKDSRSKDGYNSCCKDCYNAYKRSFDKRLRNEYFKMYKKNHKEQYAAFLLKNKSNKKKSDAEYYKRNRDKLLIYAKEYKEKNTDIIREYTEKNRYIINEKKSLCRDELADVYVKSVISRQYGIPSKEQSENMIESKRRYLKYYRLLKQLKNRLK